MSSFSDDEDMAGYSDDDYGMSSDGDQSYGEVEELPVASKVSLKSKSCFGPRCFDAFHPLPSVVSSILVSLSPCSLLLFCPSFAIGSLERERLCALVGRRGGKNKRRERQGAVFVLLFFLCSSAPPPPLRRRRGVDLNLDLLDTPSFPFAPSAFPAQNLQNQPNQTLHS
jgi:hypothetical protein